MKNLSHLVALCALVMLSFVSAQAQCGLQGDGTGGTIADCSGSNTTITYSLPTGCCQNTSNWYWDISGSNNVFVDQNTNLPVTITSGSLSGEITSAGPNSFTIEWTCVPCDPGINHYVLIVSANCIANETIRIGCQAGGGGGGGGGGTTCDVNVSEFTCLKFEQLGTAASCCKCVRIEFADGSVLYDIISAGPNNAATLCYEQPISSYTVSDVTCPSCGATGPGGDPSTEKHFGDVRPDLNVFPNPSDDHQVKVRFDSPVAGELLVEIYDVTGRVLHSQPVNSHEGMNEWSIDCGSCQATQAYTLVVLDANKQVLNNRMLLLNQ